MDRDHILIVDDERPIRELLAAILGDEGYEVACASGGEEALGAIGRTPPRLILLDLHMPIMGARGLSAALKARGIAVPIILVSAARDLAEQAAALGAVGFVAKPFDIIHLLEAVARHYAA
jgi:two-component system nitrogen regulation response regulator NtrX